MQQGHHASDRTRTFGFLLLDHFTFMSLATAMEPLRMANQLAGRELYRWYTLSIDGQPVKASDGLQITPDASFSEPLSLDMTVVCGGVGPSRSVQREHIAWLQTQARLLRDLGSICTGSWALAKAGLLDGYKASVHWECLAAMQEAFPRVMLTPQLFSIDRDRATSSGGTAPLDMMLTLIGRHYGRELAASISEMFVCDRVRDESDHQRVPLKHVLGTTQPKLLEIVALMEANLEEPIGLDELAGYVDLSRRQLERLFHEYLNCTPSRYYLKLRLTRARQLLKQTSFSIIDVASACGFVSTPHFSKRYRELFGIPPREERLGNATLVHSPITPMEKAAILKKSTAFKPRPPRPVSGAKAALEQAWGEPSYASTRIER